MRLAALAGLGRSAGLAFLASMAAPQAVQAQAARPNVLFILADNLGYGELGAYGGGATRGAPTPRLDRLAAEGLHLTNVNMEAQCTPSRSSIARTSTRSSRWRKPSAVGPRMLQDGLRPAGRGASPSRGRAKARTSW